MRRYPDKDVPFIVAGPVVGLVRKAGFTNVRALEPWQSAQVGDLTIAAAPGKHGCYEVTFVISGGGQHYAFTGGPIGDRLFLNSDKDPSHFVEAARRLVPDVPVTVISPGQPLTVAP